MLANACVIDGSLPLALAALISGIPLRRSTGVSSYEVRNYLFESLLHLRRLFLITSMSICTTSFRVCQ